MKKTIKRNLYAAVDVMAVITLLLLVAFVAKKEETLGKCFFGSLTITGVLGLVQMMFGQSKIENESGTIIHTKSEEGCDVMELSAGGSRYDIDGVKVKDKVYKLSDGCHGVVQEDGTVKVKSLTGKFVNSVMGGVLTTPPDSCWDELFKA